MTCAEKLKYNDDESLVTYPFNYNSSGNGAIFIAGLCINDINLCDSSVLNYLKESSEKLLRIMETEPELNFEISTEGCSISNISPRGVDLIIDDIEPFEFPHACSRKVVQHHNYEALYLLAVEKARQQVSQCDV